MAESSKSCFKISDFDLTYSYYIHYSDQPGYSLVPMKLNGANYQFSTKSVMHALIAKKKIDALIAKKKIDALIAGKKIGLIDGTIEEPSHDANSTEFELWNQCNSMIISWLTHSLKQILLAFSP